MLFHKSSKNISKTFQNLLLRSLEINQQLAAAQGVFFQEKQLNLKEQQVCEVLPYTIFILFSQLCGRCKNQAVSQTQYLWKPEA